MATQAGQENIKLNNLCCLLA